MRCRKVRSLLSTYCNEELTGRQQVAVREHLAGCSACRREAAAFVSVRETSREMPKMSVSSDFNAQLLNRVAKERFAETRTRAFLPTKAPFANWRLLVPAMASAALLIVVAIGVLTPGHEEFTGTFAVGGDLTDDSYMTVQPENNPNMTASLEKDWTLSRVVARSERFSNIANSLTDLRGFGNLHLTSQASGQRLRSPFSNLHGWYHFKAQPVVRVYEASRSVRTGEGSRAY